MTVNLYQAHTEEVMVGERFAGRRSTSEDGDDDEKAADKKLGENDEATGPLQAQVVAGVEERLNTVRPVMI